MNSYQSSIRKVFSKKGPQSARALEDEDASLVEHHDTRIAACALFLEMAQAMPIMTTRPQALISLYIVRFSPFLNISEVKQRRW